MMLNQKAIGVSEEKKENNANSKIHVTDTWKER